MKTPKKDRPGYIYKCPKGTKIRIKDSVECDPMFKKGGTLVFQDRYTVEEGEYRVGIVIEGIGVCYGFHPDDYEVIK